MKFISNTVESNENVTIALSKLQRSLNVPKGRKNSFGGYSYRNAEDILEAVKKIMPNGAIVIVSDEICLIGERFYIKATANFTYMGESINAIAFAREPLAKKGADESQITGAASSYARKYALNGLFLIDDCKDADNDDNKNCNQKEDKQVAPTLIVSKVTQLRNQLMAAKATKEIVDTLLLSYNYKTLDELPENAYGDFLYKTKQMIGDFK